MTLRTEGPALGDPCGKIHVRIQGRKKLVGLRPRMVIEQICTTNTKSSLLSKRLVRPVKIQPTANELSHGSRI